MATYSTSFFPHQEEWGSVPLYIQEIGLSSINQARTTIWHNYCLDKTLPLLLSPALLYNVLKRCTDITGASLQIHVIGLAVAEARVPGSLILCLH